MKRNRLLNLSIYQNRHISGGTEEGGSKRKATLNICPAAVLFDAMALGSVKIRPSSKSYFVTAIRN